MRDLKNQEDTIKLVRRLHYQRHKIQQKLRDWKEMKAKEEVRGPCFLLRCIQLDYLFSLPRITPHEDGGGVMDGKDQSLKTLKRVAHRPYLIGYT